MYFIFTAIKCKDINEEVVLAKYSEPSCDEPTTKEITPVEECRCRSGYFRYNGKCVLPIECRKFVMQLLIIIVMASIHFD